MKAAPRQPDASVNVSGTHPVREAITLVVGLIGVAALAFVLLAGAIDLGVRFLPPGLEARALGPLWETLGDEGDGDWAEQRWLQDLVDRLAVHWEDNPYELRVYRLDEPLPNAFALPGGVMLVTSGLIEQAGSENELAFVLGHELGHFRNRDHLRALGRGVAFELVLSALGAGSSDAAQLVSTTGLLADLGFSREQERAADDFGLSLVDAVYGHVAGSPDFFARAAVEAAADRALAAQEAIADYAGTHPGSASRVEDLRARARDRGFALDGELTPLVASDPEDDAEPVDLTDLDAPLP